MKNSQVSFESRYDLKVSAGHPSTLENRVKSIFEDALKSIDNRQNYRLINNVRFRTSSGTRFELDLLLLYNETPIAVIEVKKNLTDFTSRKAGLFSQYCRILNTQHFFLCSGSTFILFKEDDGLNENLKEILTVDNIRDAITNLPQSVENDFEHISNNEVINTLNKVIEESKIEIDAKTKLKEVISSATFSAINNSTFCIDQKLERKLFITLLGATAEKVCRYTSLNSIFRTINDREQSMCSIVCMNDTSELHYASRLIGYETLESGRETNSCYILSCADIRKKDDLTMWRLYGDDGKGVNIEYEVDKTFIDSFSSFAMAPVSYADSQGIDNRLELIKNLLNVTIGGARLSLGEWGIWQHFFKPYEYHDEAEIRLLFWNQYDINEIEQHDRVDGSYPSFKRKWILESTYGVVAPIVCFKVAPTPSDFPLKISSITIGPKNKEKEQNCIQIKEMALAKGICASPDNDFTSLSSIKHYR